MSRTARWLAGGALLGGLVLAWGGWGAWMMWPALRHLADPHRLRSFSIPTTSMLPTLRKGDVIRPMRVEGRALRRGIVIVFQGRDTARVDRIVGMGGDTIAMRAGRLWLNGHLVPSRDGGNGPVLEEGEHTRVAIEQLPDEPGPHRVLDAGGSEGDEYGPVRVPARSLFVLGDNRDRAADSRFSVAVGGVGLVPVDAVLGVADRLLWGQGRRDLGRPLDGVAR